MLAESWSKWSGRGRGGRILQNTRNPEYFARVPTQNGTRRAATSIATTKVVAIGAIRARMPGETGYGKPSTIDLKP